MSRIPEGSVHGRFQVLHLGHLEYLLAGADRCDFLWIGITQPESVELREEEGQPEHRGKAGDNPLRYWERAYMVEEVVRAAGIGRDRFRIVPFPVERRDVLEEYIPTSVVAFTTILEDWNRVKIELLRAQGYTVEVLWE